MVSFPRRLALVLGVIGASTVGMAYTAAILPDEIKENVGKIIPGANDTEEGTTAIVASGVLMFTLLFVPFLWTSSPKTPTTGQ